MYGPDFNIRVKLEHEERVRRALAYMNGMDQPTIVERAFTALVNWLKKKSNREVCVAANETPICIHPQPLTGVARGCG